MAELVREQVLGRLKKIEGQVRGLQRMIEQERECEDILTQLAATKMAMQRVMALVFAVSMEKCLPGARRLAPETQAALRRMVEAFAKLG